MTFYPLIDTHRLVDLGDRLLKLRDAAISGSLDVAGCLTMISWEFYDACWSELTGQVSGHPHFVEATS